MFVTYIFVKLHIVITKISKINFFPGKLLSMAKSEMAWTEASKSTENVAIERTNRYLYLLDTKL